MTTISYVRRNGKLLKVTRIRKKKLNIVKGVKRMFSAFNDYFGLESLSDRIWYYGIMSILLIALCIIVPSNILGLGL